MLASLRIVPILAATLMVAQPARSQKPEADASVVDDSAGSRVSVLDVRTAAGGTNRTTKELRQAFVRSFQKYRIQVVQDHPAIVAAHGRGADAKYKTGLARAKKYLSQGKRLYAKFDSKGAESSLQRAADQFEENAAGMRTSKDLVATYLLLARVFFATNRELQARDIFKRLVQLQPDLNLGIAEYPPQMIKTFKAVKNDVLSSPLGTLKVESDPIGALVYLDARKRGQTPIELINLPAGIHLLVVRRTGYAPFVRRVDITSFRQEKINATLQLDRHPRTHLIMEHETLQAMRRKDKSLVEYLESVSGEARLNLLTVITASPVTDGLEIKSRWFANGKALTPVRTHLLPARRSSQAIDALTDSMLQEAAEAGHIPALHARRNVKSGGGALDPTRPYRVHVGLAPHYILNGSSVRNFPTTAGAGIRLGIVRRITGRLIAGVETGVDTIFQPRLELKDAAGVTLADPEDNVAGIYTSIPLELNARYYISVGTFAPYAFLGGGVRWDMLFFSEQLEFDDISAPAGLGWSAFGGIGADYALGTGSGLYAEARVGYGQIGVGDGELDTLSTPQNPDSTIPITAGNIGLRIVMGYLMVF